MIAATTRKNAYPKYYFALLLVAIVMIWCPSCCAKMLSRNSELLNPNLACPGKNEENIWRQCPNGGYIAENPNPKICGDRYVCYVGLNERCSSHDRCAENAVCTMCGICQKCDNAENCSEFELCPNNYGFPTMKYFKRFLQNHSTKLDNL